MSENFALLALYIFQAPIVSATYLCANSQFIGYILDPTIDQPDIALINRSLIHGANLNQVAEAIMKRKRSDISCGYHRLLSSRGFKSGQKHIEKHLKDGDALNLSCVLAGELVNLF